MIRRILRAYLSLTRGERNGFFVLILIIIILLLGRILMPGIVPASIPDFKGAEEDFREISKGLGTRQVEEVVRQVKSLKREYEKEGTLPSTATKMATRVGKQLAKEVRGGMGIRELQSEANRHRTPPKKKVPDMDRFFEKLLTDLNSILEEGELKRNMDELLKYKAYLKPSQQKRLISILRRVTKRCEAYITKLESPSVGSKSHEVV